MIRYKFKNKEELNKAIYGKNKIEETYPMIKCEKCGHQKYLNEDCSYCKLSLIIEESKKYQ